MFALLTWILVFTLPALSQDANNKSMTYENHNQTDYAAIILRGLAGLAHDDQDVPIPGVAVGLFKGKQHTLIAVSQTAADGTFKFENVAPGQYRLVAKYAGFCSANVPIEVTNSAKLGRTLELHMKLAGLDSCSFGSLARTKGHAPLPSNDK